MLNVLDDCDRRGARHPSRVFIRKPPMTRHHYLSDMTSSRLFVTDTSRALRCPSPLTLDHQRKQSESSPLHRHLYALVDGCWLGIRTLVRIAGPKNLTLSYLRSPCWPWPQEGRSGWAGRDFNCYYAKLATAWMLNVLDDCDRRGARHPSRVFIRKPPMTRHHYLSDMTSSRLFVTDTSRALRCPSPLTLDHQRKQSESSPLHRHLYALVDGCWLGIRTLV